MPGTETHTSGTQVGQGQEERAELWANVSVSLQRVPVAGLPAGVHKTSTGDNSRSLSQSLSLSLSLHWIGPSQPLALIEMGK